MLDEKTGALLKAVDRACDGEGFCLIEESELLEALPRGGADRAELKSMLSFLEAERYLETRYAEDGVYCVRPLPEGRRYFEAAERAAREAAARKRDAFLFSALGSALGGFLGALLFWAVSLWL